MSQRQKISNPFEGKVRVRVCGLLIENGEILLLRHDTIGSAGYLWSPPGGGVDFGKGLAETLIQEFLEETSLHIEVDEYLFANEFISERLHAIEHFFLVHRKSGNLKLGSDPELEENEQILKEAKFFSQPELDLLPADTIHSVFNAAKTRDKIAELRGLVTFKH